MTGFANKLNEPFPAVPTPQQGVSPTGANASSNAPDMVSNVNRAASVQTNSAANAPTNSASNPTSGNRTVKSSIHDLEAWLPVRRTSTDAKASVPAACVISASPDFESTTFESITKQTTEVSQPTREPTTPTLTPDTPSIAASTSPDNEAPTMLGSGSAPTMLRCDPSPAQKTPAPAAQTNSAPSFLDIPPLECKTVFEKE